MIYIINMVLTPTIFYRSQCHVFPSSVCRSLYMPLTNILKKKCNLVKQFSNAYLFHKDFYGLINPVTRQLQKITAGISNQINGHQLLFNITIIRLLQIILFAELTNY